MMSQNDRQSEPSQSKIEISPTEDLMREHGMLKRLLLLYEDEEKRLRGYKLLQPHVVYPVILQTATIARNFMN
ncbi:hypothetical protein [Aneurinibacillus uraniidurans]|uniref:hypothetical protein n=1 Tax=Aneurinibacillus uraniidurans TaxID=2966586 RepID=UPI00234A996D|nr:hypothetical protein [Aneurinibacillus sp. B1]WCN39592.1 hypothetical protein PO771_09400 [Aneurinibacillus sp. B1]